MSIAIKVSDFLTVVEGEQGVVCAINFPSLLVPWIFTLHVVPNLVNGPETTMQDTLRLQGRDDIWPWALCH
jgi:hypothetical protein